LFSKTPRETKKSYSQNLPPKFETIPLLHPWAWGTRSRCAFLRAANTAKKARVRKRPRSRDIYQGGKKGRSYAVGKYQGSTTGSEKKRREKRKRTGEGGQRKQPRSDCVSEFALKGKTGEKREKCLPPRKTRHFRSGKKKNRYENQGSEKEPRKMARENSTVVVSEKTEKGFGGSRWVNDPSGKALEKKKESQWDYKKKKSVASSRLKTNPLRRVRVW